MKKYASTISLATLLIGVIVGGATLTNTKAEPLPDAASQLGILETVLKQNEHQDNVLANHEARITNTENDVKDLQDNTNTSASTNRTEVPIVVTVPVESEPTPEAAKPIKITSSTLQYGGEFNGFCAVTYSDGSKDNIKATITVTDRGDGQMSSSNNCADFIGQTK